MLQIIENKNSKYYDPEQVEALLHTAYEKVSNGDLRKMIDDNRELAYWYAPEVDAGTVQESNKGYNEYKTVSLVVDTDTPISTPEYKRVLKEILDKTNELNVKVDDTTLYVVMGRTEGKWVIATDKNNRPYVYTTPNSAVIAMRRLAKKERLAMNKDKQPVRWDTLRLQAYTQNHFNFDEGRIIDRFYVVKDQSGLFVTETGEGSVVLDNALIFDTDNTGEQSANEIAGQVNGRVAYVELRELYEKYSE